MKCPNKNLKEYKDLVDSLGSDVAAFTAWKRNGEEIPSVEEARRLIGNIKPKESLNSKMINTLNSLGISYKKLDSITNEQGQPLDAVAKADLLQKVVEVVESKVDITTLPEETAHIWMMLLPEESPLYRQMMKGIEKTDTYLRVENEYKHVYKSPVKLKLEAVGKLIAQEIVRQEKLESQPILSWLDKWFNNIKRKLSGIFKNFNSNEIFNLVNPYREVASKILSNDTRGLKKIDKIDFTKLHYTPVFYQLSDEQKNKTKSLIEEFTKLQNNLGNVRKLKDRHGYEVLIDGIWKPVKRSVTDFVKSFTKKIYGKTVDPSPASKALSKAGTAAHAVATNIQAEIHKFMRDKSYEDMKENRKEWMKHFNENYNTILKASIEEVKLQKEMPKSDEYYNFLKGQGNNNLSAINKRAWLVYESMVNTQKRINLQTKENGKLELFTEVPLYDPSIETAGTLDNLVIYSNGMAGIWDWKFKKNFLGDPNVIQSREFDIQIGNYKDILARQYNITHFAETRIIPMSFRMNKLETRVRHINYGYDINDQDNTVFGDITTAKEERGDELDKILDKLYKEREKLESKGISARKSSNKEEVARLNLRLGKINKVINSLVIERDVTKVESMLKFIVDDLRNRFKEPDNINSTTENTEAFKDQLLVEAQEVLNIFKDFSDYYLETLTPKERKKNKLKLRIYNINEVLSELNTEIRVKRKEQLLRFKRGNLDVATEETGFLGMWFKDLNSWSRGVFAKLSEVASTVDLKRDKDVKKFESDLQSKLSSITKVGISLQNAYNMIANKEKGTLISKYKSNVIKGRGDKLGLLEKAFEKEDFEWIERNTDLVVKDGVIKYSKEAADIIKENFNKLKEDLTIQYQDYTNGKKIIDSILIKYVEKWTSDEWKLNPSNRFVKLKDTPDTLSPEYNSLSQPVKDLYDFFVEFNELAYKITGGKTTRYFLPEIQASMLSTISQNGLKGVPGLANLIEQIKISMKTRQVDELKGAKDVNGKPINNIPLLFADHILGVISKDEILKIEKSVKQDKNFKESSEDDIKEEIEKRVFKLRNQRGNELKSYDLGRSFLLFANSLYAYKHLKDYEYYAKNLIDFSKDQYNNKTLLTDNKGKTFRESFSNKVASITGMPNNEQEALEKYIDYLFYGKKIQGKDYEIGGLSSTKIIRKAMNYMSWSALGLNIFPAVGNLIGGTANMYIEASSGRISKDKVTESLKYISKNWKSASILADYFGIGESVYEKANKISSEIATKHLSQDKVFAMMKYPDTAIKNTTMINMLKTYGIENNKIERLDRMEKKSKPLLEMWEYNDKTGTVEFNIPTEELTRFKRMLDTSISNILGSMSESNVRLYRTNLALMVLMQFKNWMPGLITPRFGKLKFDEDFQEFAEGRFKVLASQIMEGEGSIFNKTLRTFGFLASNVPVISYLSKISPALRGLKKIDEDLANMQFERFYSENKHIFKNLSKDKALERFKEMKQNQLNALGRELNMMMFFVGLILTLGNMGDDDEDKEMRASILYKLINRGALELSFFFNPMDAYQILKRPLPILNVIRDVSNPNIRNIPGLNWLSRLYKDEFDQLLIIQR